MFAIDSNNSQVSYLTEGGKVISGEVSRLSDDDMTVISELECDIGDFDVEDLYEYGSDELSKKLDDFGFDEVMLEYGVICMYDN